jgi:hypothetical protein
MTAQSIVCGACAADVPYGRLSCPSCGELLASVSGSRRTATVAAGARSASPDVLYEPAAAPAATVVDGPLAIENAPRDRDVEAELPWTAPTTTGAAGDAYAASLARAAATDPEADSIAVSGQQAPSSMALPFGTAADLNGSRTPSYMPRPGSRPRVPQPMAPAPEPEPMPEATFDPSAEAVPMAAYVSPPAVAASAVAPAALARSVEAAPSPAPAPPAWIPEARAPAQARPQAAAVAAVPAPGFAGPGAYVPPMPVAQVPAGPPAPAREWAGHLGAEGDAAPASTSGTVRLDPDTRARVLDFTRWLSVAGSAFASVGFLLPWGVVVIGSSDTGYFGRWGIAGSWHIVVALAILANLGLALIDNRVPVWLKTGMTGLGLGALLLGLVWPYLTLPALGTGPGAVIAGIGAAGLVVSGILALVTDRHAEPAKPV